MSTSIPVAWLCAYTLECTLDAPQALVRALGQVRLHVFIQTYTLVLIPIMMTLIVKALGSANFIAPEYLSG